MKLLLCTLGLAVVLVTASSHDPEGDPSRWHIPETAANALNTTIGKDYVEFRDNIPIRGTKFLIRVPQNWNGTLISDLDYRSAADSERYL